MNEPVCVEIVFSSGKFPFSGRDEVEDPLEEALARADAGEVTGGGSGLGMINIDVNLTDFLAGLEVIHDTLLKLGFTSNAYKINIDAEAIDVHA